MSLISKFVEVILFKELKNLILCPEEIQLNLSIVEELKESEIDISL